MKPADARRVRPSMSQPTPQAPAVTPSPTVAPRPTAPTAAPIAPIAPAATDGGSYGSAAPAAPRTAADVAGLRGRLDALRGVLRETQQRRADVAHELRRADPYARVVLENQMVNLDDRVVQLQSEIATTQGLAGSGPPVASVASRPPRGFVLVGPYGPSVNVVPVLLICVIVLQLFTYLRNQRRRVGAPATDAMLRDAAARLARVEQAVDAIAIEVERVSEGQRFVTRAIGEAAPYPARVSQAPRREHATPV